MSRLCLELLGPWQATLDGHEVTSFGYDKVRALLTYLAVESGCAHRRETLAGMFWPDLPERAAHNNLRQALAFLRRALGDDLSAARFLIVTRDAIGLDPKADWWLDVSAYTGLLETNTRHRHAGLATCDPCACEACAQRMQQAVSLYRGDFLAEFSLPRSAGFEQWALVEREEMQRRLMEALEQLATYHERRGEHHQAIRCVRRQLAIDAWREESHRRLMRLLACAGERSAALAQYERCRAALMAELGVEPDAETSRLYRQLRGATRPRGEVPTVPAGEGSPSRSRSSPAGQLTCA
jgi:DNA-binding SARP family transcriptional activator